MNQANIQDMPTSTTTNTIEPLPSIQTERSMGSFDSIAERWSGLETKPMRMVGSTLLYPIGADFSFQFLKFNNTSTTTTPSSLSPSSFRRTFSSSTSIHQQASLLVFRSNSRSKKTLNSPCVVAGKCTLTPLCLEEFTESMMSASQKRRSGRWCFGELEWPDVQACLTCPVCTARQKVGGTYMMIFYTLMQIHTSSKPFALGSNVFCRLMCLDCMEMISYNKLPEGNERHGGSTWTVQKYLINSDLIPIFGPNGKGLKAEQDMRARNILHYWQIKSGLWDAMEDYLGSELYKEARVMSNGLRRLIHAQGNMSSQHIQQSIGLPSPSARICFFCSRRNSKLVCVCKKAIYCSKDCGKNDWLRHQAAECTGTEETKEEIRDPLDDINQQRKNKEVRWNITPNNQPSLHRQGSARKGR